MFKFAPLESKNSREFRVDPVGWIASVVTTGFTFRTASIKACEIAHCEQQFGSNLLLAYLVPSIQKNLKWLVMAGSF